jgi:hypothetical protein
MLHGDLLHQNYTGADKIIAIMDAGFIRHSLSKAEITIEF